jgi:hypothetical protein
VVSVIYFIRGLSIFFMERSFGERYAASMQARKPSHNFSATCTLDVLWNISAHLSAVRAVQRMVVKVGWGIQLSRYRFQCV